MNNIEYGVTPQGFKAKRLNDIKAELEDLFIAEFGEINLDAQSVAGQIIGIYSKVLADIWENMQDVYLSEYPNSASGVSLDNVVQLSGITRLPASRTSVVGAATGTEGTFIPSGSLARVTETGDLFYSTQNATITRSSSLRNIIGVTGLAAQQYTVLINGVSYTYSRPIMTFSGDFVSGNAVNIRLNGVNLPTINYTTSSANTMNLIAAQLLATGQVAAATVDNVAHTITLTPVLGFQTTINTVEVSGAGAPSYSQTYLTPVDTATVAQNLAAIINTSANFSGTWVGGQSQFTIQARDGETAYALNYGNNLNVLQITSPIPFLAQEYGPIAAPAGSLNQIVTPIAGWQSITNFKAGVTGRFQETDAELRLRRANSLNVLGSGTVEAIRARLLQEVPGVTSVTVFENVTLTQSPIEVTFSQPFVSGNNIQVLIDGNLIGTVPYTTSQLVTMNAIATLIQNQPEVKTATVQGAGNDELLIEVQDAEVINISFNITGGASVPNYVVAGGRPPKSFEAVVEGGADQSVALKIWQLKPAGIQSFGNTTVPIIDSQGNTQNISFTRATPVYIWANIALVLNPQETFPANGQELVSQAVLAYGQSLGIGVDVFIQRVQAAVFTVPGIAGVTVQLAATLNPNDTPIYGTTDIDIGQTQVSVWDLSRIIVSV